MRRLKILKSKLEFIFRRVLYSAKMRCWCKDVFFGKRIKMDYPQCISFGRNVKVGDDSLFLPVTRYAGIQYCPKISFGDGCKIGVRNSFAAIKGIVIGKDVLFAGFVHITDHSHGYENVNIPISDQTLISKGEVVIEDQCWLGFGCEILSGVRIGKHSIVAARAVVTKDVPAYSIVAGNPARIVKKYDPSLNCWKKC